MTYAASKIISVICFMWLGGGYIMIQADNVVNRLVGEQVIDDTTKGFYYWVGGFLVVVHCLKVSLKLYRDWKQTMKDYPWKEDDEEK